MTTVFRSNRKASDADLIRLNSMGYSLAKVASMLGIHPTTVTLRLKDMGIPVADTRRAFMEDVYAGMTPVQLDWVSQQLGPHYSVKDLVRNLLVNEFVRRMPQPPNQGNTP